MDLLTKQLPLTYSSAENSTAPDLVLQQQPKHYSLQLRSWDTRSCTSSNGVFTFTFRLPTNVFKKAPLFKIERLVIKNTDFSALANDVVSIHSRDVVQLDSFSSYTMGVSDILMTFQGYDTYNDVQTTSVGTTVPVTTLNNSTMSFYFTNSLGPMTSWNMPFSLTILLTEMY